MSSASKSQKLSLKKASTMTYGSDPISDAMSVQRTCSLMFAPGLVQGHELRIEVEEDRVLHVKVRSRTQSLFDCFKSLMRAA